MAFSPVLASKEIQHKYHRYIKTFRIGEPYTDSFEKLIDDNDAFSVGPFLEVTDAFKTGPSIKDLIQEGLLPNSFTKVGMDQARPLYKHQEKAVRHVVSQGKNLVVSTGTGSGKTESFLIPILRELAVEAENGSLCPGVRALLIYPMNALANDQTERLRGLLADYPEITFGVYTGQTKQKKEEAISEYKKLNHNTEPMVNELVSRDQMVHTPPHILITNYAMLEYLMIRPRDNTFFDGQYANRWKFIVFDEAHVYTGSTGIEVSMLFRRLKAKLGNQKITYILTSATLGDKEDDDAVASFATNLCDAPFDKNDVIRAERIIPSVILESQRIPIQKYEAMMKAKSSDAADSVLLQYIEKPDSCDVYEALYDYILHDQNYWELRRILETPKTVFDLSRKMGWTEKQLTDFVSVASLAEKSGGKLFDARYHMFLRATESVFVTLAPDNKVMIHRQNMRYSPEKDRYYKVFEIATCFYCGSVYLIGKIVDQKLEQYNQSDDISEKEVFLLGSSISDTDEDHTLFDDDIEAEAYKICPQCGFLQKDGSKSHCEHSVNGYVPVYRVHFNGKSHTLTKCLHCENVNSSGVLRMLFSGQEAATSVIGTALFEALPSYKLVDFHKNDSSADFGDDFGLGNCQIEKSAKQFIAFSDSRQAAAYYASYLNISYNGILYKRLIIETLKSVEEQGCSAPAFVDKLQTEFRKSGVKGKSSFSADIEYSINKEAWKALLAELIDSNGNTSLSRFGLIGISVDIPGEYKKYSISKDEFQSLCGVFAMSMMTNAAIHYKASLNENDIEDFAHGGIEYSFSLSDSNYKKHIKSFIPTRTGLSNKRVDYLIRILARKGITITPDEAAAFLKLLWEKVFIGRNLVAPTAENTYRIDIERVRLFNPSKWYICSKCKRLTCHNVESVCPSYRCGGSLIEAKPAEIFKDNHYYRLYNDLELRDLRVVEHTAQLDRDTAYDYQNKFKQKEIDVLSCSTTFEMGVDVGSLETVFMRNMPPMPSNYAQRAGRAGRSNRSAAFALTFCNKSSHDFSFFNDPIRMIKGKIEPPRYSIENDRIAIRHLYAAAFGFFWRIHPEYFLSIGKFLEKSAIGLSGLDHLIQYMNTKPNDLKEYLLSWIPTSLSLKYAVDSYGWLESFIGDNGALTLAVNTFEYEVLMLEEAKRERFNQNKSVDGITQRIMAYKREDILSFLSKKNILPKYGFPVDTVEMTIIDNKNGKDYGLQLQRDLSMAISEYAPGSQIIANNYLITSRYIKKIPNIGWKMYSYIRCDSCKTLNIKPYTEGDENNSPIKICCQCGHQFFESPKVFLIPAQGFAADGDKIRRPGLKKPERSYRGETAYVGFTSEAVDYHYNVGRALIEVRTSQNDEMAILNTSPFYVCEQCGYAEIDESMFTHSKKQNHRLSSGYPCSNKILKQFSLGYSFLTDVVQIRFSNYDIEDYEKGLSILYAFIRGACSCLSIEENDIAGCLQSHYTGGRLGYSLVLFDNTPGGAGHVKRLADPLALESILKYTLSIMRGCICGGDEGDSSCYSCLRSYRNQKHHDILKRKYVIEFISAFLQ